MRAAPRPVSRRIPSARGRPSEDLVFEGADGDVRRRGRTHPGPASAVRAGEQGEEQGMRVRWMSLAAVAMVVVVPASARASGYAVSAKGGSLGIGAEATIRLAPRLNLRVGGGGFGYGRTSDLSDVEYDASLDLKGGSAALDWHPT